MPRARRRNTAHVPSHRCHSVIARMALAGVACAAGLVAPFGPAVAQTASGELDLDLAKRLIAHAETEIDRLGAPGGAIALVDAGGHLVLLERLDSTFPAAAEVSEEKARTAALFRMPTGNFEDAIKGGRAALLGVDLMTPLQGGVPIRVEGRVIGAVGVSGTASAAQDTEIANAVAARAERVGSRAPGAGETTAESSMGRGRDAARGGR